jgi:hypothetical protein
MAKANEADRTTNRANARALALAAEGEMLRACRAADLELAVLWRDIADVAWSSAEDGEPVY